MPYEIEYNGVKLEVLRVWDYRKEPLYNGPDYLYTRHQLFVRALYNPEAMAYDLQPQGQVFVPVAAKGKRTQAALTDIAIRHALTQPRKRLLWSIPDLVNGGDIRILRSPTIDRGVNKEYECDAANGPFPRLVDVVAVKGAKTFLVDFAIETFINECDLYVYSPSTILSDRWTMSEEYDQDFFTIRTTRGHIVFRTDRLLALGFVADDFRDYFLQLDVPPNFKRDRVSVAVAEDGSSADYVIVDRERAINVVAKGVTRIELIFGNHFRYGGVENAAWDIAQGFAQAVTEAQKAAASASNVPIVGPVQGEAMGTTVGIPALVNVVIGAARNNLPRLDDSLIVRVWGDPTSTRKQLIDAIEICMMKIMASLNVGDLAAQVNKAVSKYVTDPAIAKIVTTLTGPIGSFVTNVFGTAALIFSGFDYDLHVDLTGRYAEATLKTKRGPVAGLLASAVDAVVGGMKKSVAYTAVDIEGVTSSDSTMANPNLPNDQNTRSRYVENLITAALTKSCEGGFPKKPLVEKQYRKSSGLTTA